MVARRKPPPGPHPDCPYTDYLIVVDADPESPSYGSVVATAPVGSAGNDPHREEPVAPGDGLPFANTHKPA